jgi:hypothetical protein
VKLNNAFIFTTVFVTRAKTALNMISNILKKFIDVIRDLENYLRAHKIIDGGLQTKKSLNAAQAFFNEMQEQSGLSMQELSLIVAYGVGDNRVGISQQQ